MNFCGQVAMLASHTITSGKIWSSSTFQLVPNSTPSPPSGLTDPALGPH